MYEACQFEGHTRRSHLQRAPGEAGIVSSASTDSEAASWLSIALEEDSPEFAIIGGARKVHLRYSFRDNGGASRSAALLSELCESREST